MIALQLPLEVESRLEALSQKTGRTASALAVDAILDYLDELEDIAIAEERLDELRRGETKTIPLAEVMARYCMER
ncbi:MAG: CopG family transcriptional regulator [Beijerinckiaceae bacterium]|nr:CopG family transcriptional regulator [Beijerinckiaceae bacterium]